MLSNCMGCTQQSVGPKLSRAYVFFFFFFFLRVAVSVLTVSKINKMNTVDHYLLPIYIQVAYIIQ